MKKQAKQCKRIRLVAFSCMNEGKALISHTAGEENPWFSPIYPVENR